MRLLALIFSLVITITVNSQTIPHRCNADENHQHHYDNNEIYRHNFDVRKVQLDAIRAASQNEVRLPCSSPIIIPVAVHYEGVSSQTAACLEQLALSQITSLNADFAASNADIANYCDDVDNSSLDPAALAANGACIQFCLATQNHPSGFGLNNGDYAITINENYVANNNFPNFTNGVWAGYLNMFITEGTGVLGYAPLFGQANGDGVVIEACAFGVDGSGCGGGIGPGAGCAQLSVYNLGRTVTHEIGHYLGLEHIWGDGGCGQDDGINDTPLSGQEYYGCPAQGTASCGSDDMYMNYMDYVNDACMYMFSEGQATLMYNTASTLWTTSTNKCSNTPSYPLATLPSGCNPANDDAGIIAHITPVDNSSSCIIGTSVTPVVTLQNFGANTLTSVTISYEINAGAPVNFSWTGSLATGQTEGVTLAPYNEPAGAYEFKSYTNSPNGNTDEDATNNEFITNHSTVVTVNLPYQEDFEDGSFDPTNSGLTVSNPDNDGFAWAQANVSANGVGNNSAIFDNLSGTNQSNPGGTEDALITPIFDFSNVTGAELTFDVAYAQYDNTYFDNLIVQVSTDCGESYNQIIFQEGGTNLATSGNTTNAFVPASNEWNNIVIDLSAYDGLSNVSFSFVNSSGWGNNLYIDNINISTSIIPDCSVVVNATDQSCLAMGTATATASNTVGNVNYLWSNTQTTATITGLTSGTYTVTITDANGCTATGEANVLNTIVNPVPTITGNFLICPGTTTTLSTGTFASYTWAPNGETTQTITVSAVGNYTVTVTDADGCTGTATAMVSESSPISVTVTSTPESCATDDGSAVITNNSGGNYTYTWNDGNTGNTNSNIGAGTYTITITDDNGCTATETVLVENDCNCGNMAATAQVINGTTCFGECTGVATIVPTGGNGNYTYAWSNGASQATEDGLCPGFYTVTVSDSDGCTAVTDFTINEAPEIGFTTSSSPETCAGNDGSAQVSSVGIATYTYVWSNGVTGTNNTGLTAGIYTVIVTDINTQCTASETVVVGNDCGCGNMTAIAQVINGTTCFGECTGVATIVPTGGNGNYTYTWNNGASQATEDGLCPGSYTVTVSDSDGCTAVTDFTINEAPEIGFTTTSSPETCAGNDGSAQVSSVGIATYTYVWSNGVTGFDNLGLSAGSYTVVVTDLSTQCTASETVVVGNDCGGCTSLTVEAQVVSNASCAGICDGVATISTTGGNGNYTYQWSNGATQATEDGLCAGTYTVTVSDSDGCTGIADLTITEPSPITITAAATPESCAGNDGTATVTTGGNATFIWSNGNTDDFISGLTAGTYTVTATDDATGCTATETIIVGNDCGCSTIFVATQVISDASCAGVCDGIATVSATGGNGNYTYLWSNGATQATEDGLCAGTYTVTVSDSDGCTGSADLIISESAPLTITAASTPESCAGNDGTINVTTGGNATFIWSNGNTDDFLSGLATGTYTVTATDAATGCTATETVTVGNSCGCDGSLIYVINNLTPVGCSGVCDGAISGAADGGNAPYTYLWSDGQTTDSPIELCAGNYTVTVTDVNGCTYDQTIFVEESDEITLAAATTPESCQGNDGTAVATAGGANVTFEWSNGETGNIIDGLPAGTYTVIATNAGGCTASATVVVEEDCGCDFIAVEITANNTSCSDDCDGSALAESNTNVTYEWSNGVTGSVISGLCAGVYTVTATDNDGCTGTSSVVINNPNPIEAIMSGSDADCGSETGSVSVSVIGGTAPFSYIWNNGVTVGFQEGVTSGTYAVTVEDINGCSATGSVTIGGSPSISVFGIETNVSCGGESDGSIDVNVTGGTPPFTYDWDNGATTEDLTGIPTGDYVLFVTDTEGCSTGTSFTVSGAPELVIDMQVTGNTGGDNGSILAGTTGGIAPYTWQWSNGQSGVFIDGLGNGTYTVVVTDANGCTAQATATVTTTTSTLDPSLVTDWSVYPNPSSGLFQLSMNLVEKEDISIRVVNILGQTIFMTEEHTDNLNQTIDIQEFSKGTYFLEIRVRESRIVEKLILVK